MNGRSMMPALRLIRARGVFLAIGAVTAIFITAFAVTPLIFVLSAALNHAGAPIIAELREPGAQEALLRSVELALAVTSVAVPVGVALAWLIERTDLFATDRAKTRWAALLALPLAMPPYLLAMAWSLLGNGRNGLLNRIADHPWIDVYGFGGIVLVLASAAYPFSMLSTIAALRSCDPALEEAARISGAGRTRVLIDVSLPLVLPAIVASGGLIFVFATAAFGVPYLLGSAADPPIAFLTTRIYRHTTLGGTDMLERAAALSLVLIAVPGVAHLITSRFIPLGSSVQVTGKASRPSAIALNRARAPTLLGIAAFVLVFVLLPLLVIAWTSLQKTFSDPFVLGAGHWIHVLTRRETARAFINSMVLAALAGTLVVVLGLAIARFAKSGVRGGEWWARAAVAPYAVPGTVLAIGLISTYAREIRVIVLERVSLILYLPGTLGMLLIAYGVKHLAFGVKGARAALDQIHPSLEEAARLSGASPLRSMIDVTLPLISSPILAAFLLVALPCLSELTMSVLLFGAGTETTGTLLFELQSYGDPPAAAVVATLVVAIALAGQLGLGLLRSKLPKGGPTS